MNKMRKERRTLKELKWKIYKKRKDYIIFQKRSSENLIILRRDVDYVEMQNIHSLTFEEMKAIEIAYNEFTVGEFVKREISKNRKQIEEDKRILAEKLWHSQRMKGLVGDER